MTLKPLYTEGRKPETITSAEETRAVFLEAMTKYMEAEHFPKLNDEQKTRLMDKVKWLLENEFRITYWTNVACQLNLRCIEGVYQLTPKLLMWAGYRKQPVQKHKEGQTIPHAKNGKIIRSAKGLS